MGFFFPSEVLGPLQFLDFLIIITALRKMLFFFERGKHKKRGESAKQLGLLRHVEIRQKLRKYRDQNWCRKVEKCREQNVATYRHVVFENV